MLAFVPDVQALTLTGYVNRAGPRLCGPVFPSVAGGNELPICIQRLSRGCAQIINKLVYSTFT